MDVILPWGTLWVRHPTLEFRGYRDLGGKFSWEYSFRSYLHPGGAAGRTSGTGTPSGSAVGSIPTVSAVSHHWVLLGAELCSPQSCSWGPHWKDSHMVRGGEGVRADRKSTRLNSSH